MSLIVDVDILDESKECFLTYCEEVLTDRAIPAAEDGLLSSQRKILWTMEDYLKMNNKSKTKKCNAIVGQTLATSYYHGDAACYGVLSKMSQEFLMRYPLIHGQGGLGTQESNDMVASSRYCVAGDTLIATEKGTMPIKDIVPDSIDDSETNIDLYVQGGFGKRRHAVKFFNTGKRNILKIQLQNNQWIKVTPNHPLLTLDKDLNIVWKLAENFVVGDKVLISYDVSNACFGTNNDIAEAKMLGCMISEGYATTQNRIGINNKDLDMINPVVNFIKSKINTQANICYNKKRDYYEYCFANAEFYNTFINTYEFSKSKDKHLPKCFMEGTKEYQAICLAYLFEGDGSVDNNHGISYSSISEELIHQLQVILLQNFGIISSINHSSKRNEIKLYINNVSAERFQNEIGFISERKKSVLNSLVDTFKNRPNIANSNICCIHEITNYVRKNCLEGCVAKAKIKSYSNIKTFNQSKEFISKEDYDRLENIINNYYYIPITSIEMVESENAYSIKIDDDTHSFIGNGFVNHNTEAKPSKYADLMMNDFAKNVVPTKETYNGEFMEPVVLPSLFPNALCNGKQAIGVSMAHNSLPNNLTEVCNAIIHFIEHDGITIDELLSYMPGPDFPLDNIVINQKDVREAFRTGKSSVSLKVRGRYKIDKDKIIFTSIPYRTYRDKIREQITKNVDEFDKIIDDFNDESSLGVNRLIFKVKSGVDPERAVLTIFKLTDLQTTVSYNMNYIVNGTPKLCSMIDLIQAYYQHQTTVLINATKFDKDKAEKRLHILQGLKLAVDKIDAVIALIRSSKDKSEARQGLIKLLAITEIQANAILDMKLSRLTKLDAESIDVEIAEKETIIEFCNKIIEDKIFRDTELIKKISEMRDKYGDARRTELCNIEVLKEEKEIEAIKPEDVVVVTTKGGLVKRIPKSSFKIQKRNGAGIKTQDELITNIIPTNTIDHLLVFTNIGKMYKILVDDIPTGTNASKGTSLKSLIPSIGATENVTMTMSLARYGEDTNLVFVTKDGYIKKTALKEYKDFKRKTGVIAIKLKDGDSIADIVTANKEDVIITTKNSMSIHFSLADVPFSSRTTIGVKAIKLDESDEVVSCIVIKDTVNYIGVAFEDGLGKKIEVSDFPIQGRAGKGVQLAKDKILVGAVGINNEDNLLISTRTKGICISAADIPILGRQAAGNKLIKEGKIISIGKI